MGAKGSAFEREISKALSKWWTHGERDDVFWRSSASGARATQRRKTGKSTFGQEGDIQATDPIGQPLIDLCTIELKTGYKDAVPISLIDKLQPFHKSRWFEFVKQCVEEQRAAGAYGWLLIMRRNNKQITIFMPSRIWRELHMQTHDIETPYMMMNATSLKMGETRIYGISFYEFLNHCMPEHVERAAERWHKKLNDEGA
jgi:hypothetical protein